MKKFKNYIALACGMLIFTGGFQSAEAGFEWRGMPNVSTFSDNTEFPAPVGDMSGPMTLAVPVAPVTMVDTDSDMDMSMPMSSSAISSNPMSAGNVVVGAPSDYRGFGRDIPLGMAVKQIVPQNMDVVYENPEMIRMNAPVSWTGDGSWESTLDKLLNKQGLSYVTKGQNVHISSQMRQTSPAPMMTTSSVETISLSPTPMPVKTLPSPNPVPVAVHQTDFQPMTAEPMAPIDVTMPFSRSPAGAMSMTSNAWIAGPQDTLRQTLERWSMQNGTRVQWATDYDFRLKQAVSFDGSYESAVESLLDSFRKVEPRPYAELAPTASGQRVLIVRVYGAN